VCLSPEGTRTLTPKLAEFKKGAFHLAMQAGVPVVPIVIHNSNDVQPKGDFIYHPGTVDVEVLPPIDTSNWSKKTIDKHVADVRNMYLTALDQGGENAEVMQLPETAPATKPKPKPRKKKTRAAPRTKTKTIIDNDSGTRH
jgi:putative phosphoserine phosphatase/1-acylglycerol-3-phosphate O-acyltransferase